MRRVPASATVPRDSEHAAEPLEKGPWRRVVDARGTALAILALCAAIFVTRYMKEVLIPFVLAGLVFYALDPLVDWLQCCRMPRALGAGLALGLVVSAAGGIAYSLQDEAIAVVEELPEAAREIRGTWAARRTSEPSAIEKVQEAARELEKTAAAATGAPETPSGVDRVQIEEPLFRASAYLRWGSLGMIAMLGQAALILLLSYFLLLNDELLKRKLVENIGPTLARKRITVQILNEIGGQIERFLMVQIFTSVVVTMATGLALSWMGLRHAWIWGIAAGVFNVIPYLGPVVVSAGLGVIGFVQFESLPAAFGVASVAFVITTVEGYWLTPVLMGKVAQINQTALFAGLLFWSWLWGPAGMLLAVPMMMVAKAICDHVEDLKPVGKMLGD